MEQTRSTLSQRPSSSWPDATSNVCPEALLVANDPGDIGIGLPPVRRKGQDAGERVSLPDLRQLFQPEDEENSFQDLQQLKTGDNDVSLPDLRDRLREYGAEEEYMRYRRQYRFWRARKVQSCISDSEAEPTDPYKFEFWYPTPSIFRWRFTAAYWTAIFFVLGSLLFTFNSTIGVVKGFFDPPWSEAGIDIMTTWPNFIGGICFVLGAFSGYVQLINLPTEDSAKAVLIWPDWQAVLERVEPTSAIGTLAYFVGALFFQVGASTFFLPPNFLSTLGKTLVIGLPNFIGSALFVTGGVCEILHNRMFRRGGATCADAVWWASILNSLGGVFFLLGSVPGLFMRYMKLDEKGEEAEDYWTDGCFAFGSFLFILSSVLLIVMWRSNDFGLTLLKQLNTAIRAGATVALNAPTATAAATTTAATTTMEEGRIAVQVALPGGEAVNPLTQEEAKPKFSLRGAFFLFIYTWFAFVAIIDIFCKHLWAEFSCASHPIRQYADIIMEIIMLCVIGLVLALHSVVTHVPHEQPYRAVVFGCRFLGFIGALTQTATFVDFCVRPYDRAPLPAF